MRFYLDEDVSHRIAALARSLGVDVLSPGECGTTRFLAQTRPHAGVLFVPASMMGRDYGGATAAIVRNNRDRPNGMPPYMIDYPRRPLR